MASVVRDPNGRKRIQFVAGDSVRRRRQDPQVNPAGQGLDATGPGRQDESRATDPGLYGDHSRKLAFGVKIHHSFRDSHRLSISSQACTDIFRH